MGGYAMLDWAMLAAWVAIMGAVLTIGATTLRIIRSVRAFMERQDQFLKDWRGVQERPGISLRQFGVLERLTEIEKQFRPNNGHTMKDALDRIERDLAAHRADGHGG